ncbi:MAG: coenzyme F420-0:L-glutamate ligase [Alphaproteobacteria bacterium]|nr:coenzyme F420-0:L-glutamate ligase [Alphaproteobacteria bacterium]
MNKVRDRFRRSARTAHTAGFFAIVGIPPVKRDDDIAALIGDALIAQGETLVDGDIVVIAQKIVSKAEGRCIDLATVTPSLSALDLAGEIDKDPRLVELILAESGEVLRTRPGLIVVAHRLGFVLANAGIDQSNIGPDDGRAWALLLPIDPDASCRRIGRRLGRRFGCRVGVIINDSLGRAWRNGTIGTAIGVDGVQSVLELRGHPDLFGRPLQTTAVGVADEIAAAASLIQGQTDEGHPVVIARGLSRYCGRGSGADLVREREQDLFR